MRFANYAVLILLCCGELSAIGGELRRPQGTWVIDVQKTEEFLTSTPPPENNAESLPGVLLQMCVTTMTFSGETLTKTSIGPFPTTESFKLIPLSNGVLTYALITSEGKEADTIVVHIRDSEHLTIKSARMELMAYGVWRRGQPSTPQTGEMDFNRALQACTAMLQNRPSAKPANRNRLPRRSNE